MLFINIMVSFGILIIVLIVVMLLIGYIGLLGEREHFDFENTYPYYRDPYSLYLWYGIKEKTD